MTKLGLLGCVLAAGLVMACGAASGETTGEQAQAMCAADSDTCGINGYPVHNPSTPPRVQRPVGTCVDRPTGVSYAAFGNATANPIAGWSPKNASDPVWQFEDYIVRSGYVAATDQVYFLAPNSGTGFSWYAIPLQDTGGSAASDKYNAESNDPQVRTVWASTYPVDAHVVTCTLTTYDPDTGDANQNVTYWSVHDPGACTSGGCGSSHPY